MRRFLRSLFCKTSGRSTIEKELAYLNCAVSRYDLERREREIEKGLFRKQGAD